MAFDLIMEILIIDQLSNSELYSAFVGCRYKISNYCTKLSEPFQYL